MRHKVRQFFVRTSSFVRKEIFEDIRQPWLVLTLILGPFLILLLFGLGFTNEPAKLRTLFVVEKGSHMRQYVESYMKDLGPQLIFAGVTTDAAVAQEKLKNEEVDVVAIVPTRAYETIREGRQATFTLYHREIDPMQKDYMNVFGRVYVEELNRRILRFVTRMSQEKISKVQDELREAHLNADAFRESLERGDTVSAREHQRDLVHNLDQVAAEMGAPAGQLSNIQEALDTEYDEETTTMLERLSETRQNSENLDEFDQEADRNYDTTIRQVEKIEADLEDLDEQMQELLKIAPYVLISPFRSDTQAVSQIQLKTSDYFVPAVIILLVQHLTITFAALSIVRERQAGTFELFRIAPLSPGETLLGKYLAYFAFTGLLAVILTLLVHWGLNVPILGSLGAYALVVVVFIFTASGIGFVISLLAKTTSQSVQYSMMILLASVFFSGAFINLRMLAWPVEAFSWALPATYGIALLQDIMLRGRLPDPTLLGGLFAFGLAFLLIASLLIHRLMTRG